MASLYNGDASNRTLQHRLASLERKLASLESGNKKDVTKVTNVQSILTNNLDAHLIATDPHPQYLLQSEGDASYMPLTTPLYTKSRILTSETKEIPQDYQLIVYNNLVIEGNLTVLGDLIIL